MIELRGTEEPSSSNLESRDFPSPRPAHKGLRVNTAQQNCGLLSRQQRFKYVLLDPRYRGFREPLAAGHLLGFDHVSRMFTLVFGVTFRAMDQGVSGGRSGIQNHRRRRRVHRVRKVCHSWMFPFRDFRR
jgi:hypothetical protein